MGALGISTVIHDLNDSTMVVLIKSPGCVKSDAHSRCSILIGPELEEKDFRQSTLS
jgi:hypothetical protein